MWFVLIVFFMVFFFVFSLVVFVFGEFGSVDGSGDEELSGD